MLKGLSSVRARLLGLALLAVAPLIALFGWNAWQVREQAIAGAKDELSRGARFLAEGIANDVRAAHQVLHALGAHPDVRAGLEPGCGRVLRARGEEFDGRALARHRIRQPAHAAARAAMAILETRDNVRDPHS